MKLSILILDFLKSRRVVEGVTSLLKQQVDFPFEIIVADNSCNEENARKLRELEQYKNVVLVFNEKNLGYTRGVNAAAKQASGDYLLVLNPDIVCREPTTLRELVNFMDQYPNTAIMGPKQVDDPTGTVAMTVRAFPNFLLQVARRTWLRHIPGISAAVAHDEMQDLDHTKIQPVDWLQSSCCIVRRDFWESVGGLDERYFLFMSDPELAWQAWSQGKEVIYNPKTTVYADGLRCSAGGFLDFFQKWTLRQHVTDSLKYTLKHLGEKNPRSFPSLPRRG